jgi:hypothetical protein
MKIKRELKFASFEWDDEEKTIVIVTRLNSPNDTEDARPINGRIKLNKTYSFALLRFVVRIAQRNWFRKWTKTNDSEKLEN